LLAVLYDIHGNLGALEAVLADAEATGAERFLLGGDFTLFGAWPCETLTRLSALPAATWVRGNGERWTAHPAQAPADATIQAAITSCVGALGIEAIAELDRLATAADVDGVHFVHASPISDLRSFAAAPNDEDGELLGPISAGRLVFGHTHLQFRRAAAAADVELANPGSVGMPFDGDRRAAYALLERPGGALELKRVAYDWAASAAAVRERFGADGGWAEIVAGRIERAAF